MTCEVVTDDSSPDDSPATSLEVHTFKKKASDVMTQVNGKRVNLLVYMGLSVPLIVWDVYQSLFTKGFLLQPASIKLHSYSRRQIPVRGCFVLTVKQGITQLGLDRTAALYLHFNKAQMRCFKTLVMMSGNKGMMWFCTSWLCTPGLGLAKG